MRYIITGTYKNGDQYGDATESIAELAYILSDINRFDYDATRDDQRVLSNTITVTTEGDQL